MRNTMLENSLLALWAAAGCANPETLVAAPTDVGPVETPRKTDGPAAAIEVPGWFQCVSSPSLESGEPVPSVWRLGVRSRTASATGWVLDLRRGAQFRERANSWMADRVVASGAVASLSSRPGVIEVNAEGGVALLLASAKGYFRGSLSAFGTWSPVVCWDPASASPWSPAPKLFVARYDFSTGRCRTQDGADAISLVPIEIVRETGLGTCVDLSGQSLNGDDFAGPRLSYWSLNGAKLDGARLFFADLPDAMLGGADLSGLDFGYATVSGHTDGFTRLPPGGDCSTTSQPWGGAVTTCAR